MKSKTRSSMSKFLSMLLALTMVLSMIPMTVFAENEVSQVVLPVGVTTDSFGDNTVTDGTDYYATLQAAVEAVCGNSSAVLYCKPAADVGSLQHAPVTADLTIYGNGACVSGGAERDFDIGNTDPSGGKDVTANMTLTVYNLSGCGAWGAKATEHTVNLVFEGCKNMGKVFITGTSGTLNIKMTDCTFEGVISEAVYSNADGEIKLTNVAFSDLTKAINLNHKATGTQTVIISDCTFTDCGNNVSKDEIPVRVLSSVADGESVLTVSNCTFSGTPEGGADILLDYGVGTTTATVSGTAANVTVETENNVVTTTTVSEEENKDFTNVAVSTDTYFAQIGGAKFETLAEAFAAAQTGDEVQILVAGTYSLSGISGKNITVTGKVDGVVFDDIGAFNMGSANVTFNNVTFDYYPNVNYTGLQHSGDLVYNNCIINGQVFLYGASETFNDCEFNQNSADAYNVWTYGAKKVEFNGCTFNSAGKSVLVYTESTTAFTNLAVANTTFYASAAVVGKAAIEIDTSLSAGANITVDAATTATGFDNGSVSGNSLWNNKKGSEGDNNDITIVEAGETVLAPTSADTTLSYAEFNNLVRSAEGGIYDGGDITVVLKDSERSYQNNKTAQFFIGATNVNITDPVETVKVSNVNFVFEDDDTTNTYTSGELQVFAKYIEFTDCTFNGVAVSPWGMSNAENAETAVFTNCEWNNLSGRYGVHQNRASALTITGCEFNNCERGIHTNSSTVSSITITDNTFTGIGDGYGVLCLAESNGDLSKATLNISGNIAEGQTMLRQLSSTLTYEQVTAILDTTKNTYGTAYVSGSIEPAAPVYVAQIGSDNYSSLQDAIDAAEVSGGTITLLADCADDVTVEQAPDVKITIDGADKTFTGTITVDGKSAAYATAGLTIKNIKFDATNITKDASINLGGNNSIRYTSNVTVDSCTFTGTDNAKVAVKNYTGGCKNVTITNCTATGLHSLAQLKTSTNVTVTKCTVTDSKSGVSLGSSTGVIISENTMTGLSGYGVRADGGANISISDCDVSAFIPVVIRNVSEDASLTFSGSNTMSATNTDGIWCAIGDSEYEENGKLPTTPETGKVVVTLNGTGLDADGVYGEYIAPPAYEETGAGTEDDPYQLDSKSDLVAFAEAVNGGESYAGKYFKLTDDIDLSVAANGIVSNDTDASNWTPIGTMDAPFKGSFDGNGKTISNLKIDGNVDYYNNGTSYVGLFGYVNNGGYIKNVTIENVKITGCLYVGAVVGRVYIGGVIDNCHVSGDIDIEGYWYVGGIAGRYEYGSGIYNCSVTGSESNVGKIEADYHAETNKDEDGSYVGGILGFTTEPNPVVTISGNSVSYVNIYGVTRVGGLSGIAHYGNIFENNSVSNVKIYAYQTDNYNGTDKDTIGLIAGACQGTESNPVTFTGCTAVDTTAYLNDKVHEVGIYGENINGEEPVTNYVAKVGSVVYTSLQEAIDAANGKTVTVLTDIEVTDTVTVPAGVTVTLDLNGKTISQTKAQSAAYAMIENNGILTIMDGSDEQTGTISYSDITVYTADNKYASNTIKNLGTLNVVSGTIENTSSDNVKQYGYPHAIDVYPGSTTNISGGTVESSNYDAIRMFCNSTTVPTVVNISGGTIINRVTFQSPDNNYHTACYGVLNITGGTFESTTGKENVRLLAFSKDNSAMDAEISGGTFDEGVAISNNTGETVTWKPVKGGTFPDTSVADYIAPGYVLSPNVNGTYGVEPGASTYVASFNGEYYLTLAKAVEAANTAGNGIIYITADATVTDTLTINDVSDIIIDLKGNTITGTPTEAAAYAVITNNGTLTIKDSGTGGAIVCDHKLAGSTGYAVNTILNAGNLKVQGGTIENKSNASNQIGYAIDNNSTSTAPVVEISGGEVKVSGSSYYDGIRLFCNSETNENSVTVSGGTVSSIWLQNPSDGSGTYNTKDVKGSVTINGGTVNALYLEPSTAFEASITGGTIGSVSYHQTAEGRDLTAFITGGTFLNDVSKFCEAGYGTAKGSDGKYTVAKLPNAEVINLGSITIDEYSIYNGSLIEGGESINLQVAMEFIAKDSEIDAANHAFADYITDFYITIDGMAGDYIEADDCYLAGHYGDFGWIMIPLDDMIIDKGKVYPVITSVAFEFTYEDICTSVKDFKCGIYFSNEIIEANPDMEVTLTLGLSEDVLEFDDLNDGTASFITVDEPYTYAVKEFNKVASVTDSEGNTTYYGKFADAIAAAADGDTITLMAPIVVDAGETLTLDKKVTITYTSNVPGEDMITNKGKVVIDGATLVYTNTDTTASNVTVSTISCEPGSVLEVKSGTVKNDSANNAANGIYAYAIDLLTNSSLGDVTATISGGEVISTNYMAIRQFNNGDACKNTLTITNGYIYGAKRAIQVHLKNDAAYLEISDGKVEAGEDGYALCLFPENATHISVTGGEFIGTVYSGTVGFISGGTFTDAYVADYLADGYVLKSNSDGTYGVSVTLPEVEITPIKDTLTDSDPDLTFALNFAIKDIENLTEEYLEQLFAVYGDYYTDYVLTISGLSDPYVTFNANGNMDGYLAGQYDAWSENWVSVPFEDVVVNNDDSLYIMEYAAKLMGQSGLRFTLKEVAAIVQNFDCGVYFTPEFLADNPNLEVTLELKVFTEDAEGNKINDISVATKKFNLEEIVAIVHSDNKQSSYHDTLAAAVEAADSGDTVTLLKDVVTTETYTIAEDIVLTLDMNGKTITATDEKASGNYELFYNYGELTVIGNGNIELTATTDRDWNAASTIIHNRGGVLTIENGTFTHKGGTDMAYVIDNSGNSYGDATTNIKGGTITSTYIGIRNRMDTYGANGGGNGIATVNISGGSLSGKYAVWGQVASSGVNGKINVTGGTLTGAEGKAALLVDSDSSGVITTAVSGGTFSSAVPEEYCADGYIPVDNGDGTYGVKPGSYVAQIVNGAKYETVQAALNAASSGDTVVLTADASESMVMVPAGVTLDLKGKDLTVDYLTSFGSVIDSNSPVSDAEMGKLIAPKDAVALRNDNGGYFPVWDSETECYEFGYVLIRVNDTVSGFNDSLVNYQFRIDFTGGRDALEGLMVNNETASVMVQLVWTTNSGNTSKQNFILPMSKIQYMYENQSNSVLLKVSGLEGIANIQISTVYDSVTGVECYGGLFTVSTIVEE